MSRNFRAAIGTAALSCVSMMAATSTALAETVTMRLNAANAALTFRLDHSVGADRHSTEASGGPSLRIVTMRYGSTALKLFFVLSALAFFFSASQSNAANETRGSFNVLNTGVIRMVTEGVGYDSEQSFRDAKDIARSLDKLGKMRVLPIVGHGSVRNTADLLLLRGVDVAIVHSDVFARLKQLKMLPGTEQKLRYIVKLYSKTFHVIARREIESLVDLDGRNVAVGAPGGSNEMSAKTLFSLYGLKPKFINYTWEESIQKILDNQIAAIVYPAIKPVQLILKIGQNSNLHFLDLPLKKNLTKIYSGAELVSDDYPHLIPKGQHVNTLQFGILLATINWSSPNQRYSNVKKFIEKFLDRADQSSNTTEISLWTRLNVSETVPGWERYRLAQAWINQKFEKLLPPSPIKPALYQLRSAFLRFLDTQQSRFGTGRLSMPVKKTMFNRLLSQPMSEMSISIKMNKITANGIGQYVGIINAANVQIDVGGQKEVALALKLNMAGLRPGRHAFLVHEHPSCGVGKSKDVVVPGMAAGRHYVSTKFAGKSKEIYLGDLPDIIVKSNGSPSENRIVVRRLTVADLVDRSIIIHSGPDDMSARQVCGVIR